MKVRYTVIITNTTAESVTAEVTATAYNGRKCEGFYTFTAVWNESQIKAALNDYSNAYWRKRAHDDAKAITGRDSRTFFDASYSDIPNYFDIVQKVWNLRAAKEEKESADYVDPRDSLLAAYEDYAKHEPEIRANAAKDAELYRTYTAAKATENENTTTEDNAMEEMKAKEDQTMTNTNYYELIKAAAADGNDYAKKAIEFINEATMNPIDITEHAYQLTAYERYCGVDREDLKKYVAAEFMEDPSVYAINDYLEDIKYYDDIAYSMDDFNEICGNMEPWEIARSCYYGDFKPCDEMFYFNGYGNLTSCDEYEYVNQWRDDVNAWILTEEKTEYMTDEAQEIMDSDNSMAIMTACDALISLGF